MKSFSSFVVNHKKLIVIIGLLLIIPALIGFALTKTNYDILVYLPDDIETLKGQNILKDDFNLGSFSISLVDNKISNNDLINLENEIRNIDCVNEVVSINDITGLTIPLDVLPKNILNRVSSNDSKLLFITFKTGTTDDETEVAINEIKKLSDSIKVGGMSAMSLDTRKLVESQTFIYVLIAVICCLFILMISLDSYIVPLLLLGNIGLSILFNMGTNVFLGQISYITKAIAAVLQLGVTTDFSIFLYHKYEAAKKSKKTNDEAMIDAINETMTSVVGSSLTTIAGFLALCSMKFSLGTDIGLVMAKGVVFGVLTVLTIYPSIILLFDKIIRKTKHKPLIPKFRFIKPIVTKGYKWIFAIFILLLIPVYLSQRKTEVYYNLDKSIPDNYDYSIVSKKLKDEYGLITQSIVLVDSNIENNDMNNMIDELQNLDGVDNIISSNILSKYGISNNIIPLKIRNFLETDKYKLMLINSNYELATDELNVQIKEINKIIKKYDKNAILAGEGPLMNDLVEITAIDLRNVNYVSIGIIFLIMFFVLKSFSLPILLVTSIEFAIFINMGIPYWQDNSIPFVSSIVIGTIQLGATIDYAILLTTKYLEERKSGKDKISSMNVALESSVSSIFVSAMCFFAATFSVFAVSKIDMIGSLCLLMSRGAIISMGVVMLIVPSILLVFDKLITKTTIGFMKGKGKMKTNVKKGLACLLVFNLLFITKVNATTKEESVYAKLDSNGSVNNVIVSERLYDITKDKINDKTELFDIKNLNGNNNFKQNGNNLVWETNGEDVYYQGTYKKDLPISVNVKYYLNGEEKNVNDILGKKGKIKIELKYNNINFKKMKINGKEENIYVPYMIVTTSILNNADNKNIKVSNGRIVDNGVSSIIIALSSPGLYESLNFDNLKDMDKVEISYETNNFELNSIYSVATTDVIDSKNLGLFDEVNDLYKKIDELQSNMDKIVKASKQLSDGTTAIDNGITKLNSNLKLLVKKYEYYRNQNQDTLKEELIKIVKDNIKIITPALEEEITTETSKVLKSHKEELQKAMIESLKKNTQVIVEEELKSIINSLDINDIVDNIIKKDITNLLNNDDEINNLTKVLKDKINNKLNSIINEEFNKINGSINNNMSDEYINYLAETYNVDYDTALRIANDVKNNTLNQVKENISNANIPDKIIESLNEENYVNNLVKEYIKKLNSIINEYLNNDALINEYEEKVKEKIIKTIEERLSDDNAYINVDIKKYIDGVVDKIIDKTVSDLADTYTEEYTGEVVRNVIEKEFSEENVDSKLRQILNKYEDDVKDKVNILDDTIKTLTTSMDTLNNGSNLVAKGTKELSKGLEKYNKLGINKISKLVNGPVKSTEQRLKSIVKLNNQHELLDEKEESTEGKSKIIFMIDSVTQKQNNKEKKVPKEEKEKRTFWEKVNGLFK